MLFDLPELWSYFDSTDYFWRGLLGRALDLRGRSYLEGDIGRSVTANVVASLDIVAAEDESFLKDIVDIQPDWSDLQVSDDAWGKIPSSCRSRVLGATADGWLKRFLGGETTAIPTSKEIRSCVVTEARVREALRKMQSPSPSVELFEQLSELSEQLFTWWVGSVLWFSPRISDVTALRIGELISSRRWRSGADEVSRLAEQRQDLRPAIKGCISLLGMLRRVQLFFAGGLTSRSEVDIWSALQELGLELYTYGPGVNDLWSRAGGHASDLFYFASGRDSWATLISQARAGRHKVTVESLVYVMLEDYPNNLDLKRVARLLDEN